jgi:hypothetical protein
VRFIEATTIFDTSFIPQRPTMPPLPVADASQRPEKPGHRVSLACVQCRSRHLRCNAEHPCSRCRSDGSDCTYVKSRRGNKTRVQQPIADATPSLQPGEQESTFSITASRDQQYESVAPIPAQVRYPTSSDGSSFAAAERTAGSSVTSEDGDSLLELYFTYFHPSQPCVLPLRFLKQRRHEDPWDLCLLISVLHYVGSFFTASVESEPLEAVVKNALPTMMRSRSPFVVQALSQYAIAVYWCNEGERARSLINAAVAKAIDMGMHTRSFAVENSHGDPVLAESWRRTWWVLYATDLHMAWSDHTETFPSSTLHVTASVDLPCEEEQYECGVCG